MTRSAATIKTQLRKVVTQGQKTQQKLWNLKELFEEYQQMLREIDELGEFDCTFEDLMC